MDMEIREKVKKFIQDNRLIEKGDRIVVALSGGPDSVMMLHVLNSLKEELDLSLHAVHIHHMIRQESADLDMQHAMDICKSMDIEISTFKVDVPKLAKETKQSLEEAGRVVRYEKFELVRSELGATSIAVAQNMNDQAETMLMRLMRGAGLEGLKSILPKRGRVIRPILCLERHEIEEYLREHGTTARTDETNLEEIYHRNKIRLGLIPYIKENFNGNIIQSLYRSSQLLSMDLDYIESQVELHRDKFTANRLDRNELRELHPAIISRVIRKILETRSSIKDVGKESLDEVVELITSSSTGKKKTIKGITFEIAGEMVLISKDSGSIEKEPLEETVLSLGVNFVRGRKVILSEHEPSEKFKCRFAFDVGEIGPSVTVRNRKDGDRFVPFGMKGQKKLKDFLIDMKIPSSKRDDLIIFTKSSGEIILVDCLRRSNLGRIDESTRKILCIDVEKLND